MHRTPALIVGGGPAGAAAAIVLAGGGHPVRLIERKTTATGTVCGGFLGWDALGSLATLGIDATTLGAHPITRLRLVAGGRRVEAALPHPAAGLSRLALDEALLAFARERGAQVERGRAVRSIEGRAVLLDDGETLAPEILIAATGKHGLRGLPRRGDGEGAVGFRAAIPAPPGIAGTIELHLLPAGYAGLLVQEDGRANLCLSIAAARLRDGGGIARYLTRHAPRLLDRIGILPERWDTIAGVPYGWRARAGGPGLYRIGDQAAVIGSLAGDGVAIALASGRAAATAIRRGEDAPAFQPRFAARARRPLLAAEWLRHAAERPALQPWLLGAARLPGLTGLAARLTRIGR